MYYGGELVRISGPAGEVTGVILCVLDPSNLPQFEGGPDAGAVSHILAEQEIVQVALVGYDGGTPEAPQPVMFGAFLAKDGRWIDLQHQVLQIVPLMQPETH
jgi:hypothetical protein